MEFPGPSGSAATVGDVAVPRPLLRTYVDETGDRGRTKRSSRYFAMVAATANRGAWQSLARWEKPFLTAFSDQDPITGGGDRIFQKLVPGAQGMSHTLLPGGGHFLQEAVGPELARVVADLIPETPVR